MEGVYGYFWFSLFKKVMINQGIVGNEKGVEI